MWTDRYPLENCPTRINPEIIKRHEIKGGKWVRKPGTVKREKLHTYSFKKVALDLHLEENRLARRAKERFGVTSTMMLTNENIEELIALELDNKKKRKEATAQSIADELKINVYTLLSRARSIYKKPWSVLTTEERNNIKADLIKRRPRRNMVRRRKDQ